MEMIMYDSPEAAKPYSGEAWETNGLIFKDESSARWYGCTHVICQSCGKPVRKTYKDCLECMHKKEQENYDKRPKIKWDGTVPLWSYTKETFYFSLNDLRNEEDIKSLQLYLTRPIQPPLLTVEYFGYDADQVDTVLLRAMDEFNHKTRHCVVGWQPLDQAVTVEGL